MENTRLTDRKFFTECLDRSIPELAPLAALAEAGEFAEAQRRFAAYVRRTLDPAVYLAGEKAALEKNADRVLEAAARPMKHHFISCRVPYTFGEVIDWEFNPTYNGYKEWPWQLNRHPEWRAMAEAYLLTGDEAYPAEWSRQFMSWARQAQVPENASGFATVCWRTIEAGIRMQTWMYVLHAYLRSPSVSDEVLTAFCKSFWEHGWRLRNFCTAFNWLITEMHGLARIGMFLPFFAESAEWLAYAHRRLEGEIDTQIYPDGMQYELTTGYHHVCVANYEAVVQMIRRAGQKEPEYLRRGLMKMYAMYPKLAAPDLMDPTMNDGGRLNAVYALRRATELYPDVEEFRYFASRRAEGAPPAYRSILMEYGGAVIFRSSWEPDALWAYMDASPFGKAHQHEDKLNVQIWAFGHELLPEAGTFDYDTSEMRRYVLSTRGHNTARIDGMDQNRRDGYVWKEEDIRKKADVFFETTDARDVAEASYTEGYGPQKLAVTHTRRWLFLKAEAGLPPMFVAVDRFAAQDDARHRYELIWHLHDNPATVADGAVHSAYEDGVGLTVARSDGGVQLWRGVKAPEFQGWLPRPGVGDVEHFPIPTILNTGYFTGARRVVTVLCPYDGGAPRVAAVIASPDAAETTFTVRLADGREVTVSE